MSRRTFFRFLFIIVVFGVLGFSGVLFAQGRSQEALEHVKQVQERNTERFMAKEGVVGTAIGLNNNGKNVIVIMLEKSGVPGIPETLEDVPVDVEVTGKIYARANWFVRPVPIGVSTGNRGECSAGTISCRVVDGDGNVYALSNNHVYALENDAPLLSEVLQPGLYDTWCAYDSENVIGHLADFEPIVFGRRTYNRIDAAIAETSTGFLGYATPSDGYGVPSSTPFTSPYVGLAVQKYGRTTGLTAGNIAMLNATVNVGYSSGTARFVGQIVISPGIFSDSGDSGSLIVTTGSNQPVGLLFAGSSSYTIANPIDLVLERFGVTIDDGTEEPIVAPVADFMGSPTSSNAPLTVDFTDLSTGGPDSWSWTFGDGGTSTAQNPSYTYDNAGVYTVSLTVTNSGGSDTETKTDYITVSAPGEEATTVSVTSISYATQGGKNHDKHLLITLNLEDDLGNVVSGATVSIRTDNDQTNKFWTGTGTTGTSGTITFSIKNAPSGTYTTTVTNVSASGLTWDGVTPSNSFSK